MCTSSSKKVGAHCSRERCISHPSQYPSALLTLPVLVEWLCALGFVAAIRNVEHKPFLIQIPVSTKACTDSRPRQHAL